MTATQTQPWLRAAGAAAELDVPVWMIEFLLKQGVLHDVRIDGARRIPAREVHAFRRIHCPKEKTRATP